MKTEKDGYQNFATPPESQIFLFSKRDRYIYTLAAKTWFWNESSRYKPGVVLIRKAYLQISKQIDGNGSFALPVPPCRDGWRFSRKSYLIDFFIFFSEIGINFHRLVATLFQFRFLISCNVLGYCQEKKKSSHGWLFSVGCTPKVMRRTQIVHDNVSHGCTDHMPCYTSQSIVHAHTYQHNVTNWYMCMVSCDVVLTRYAWCGTMWDIFDEAYVRRYVTECHTLCDVDDTWWKLTHSRTACDSVWQGEGWDGRVIFLQAQRQLLLLLLLCCCCSAAAVSVAGRQELLLFITVRTNEPVRDFHRATLFNDPAPTSHHRRQETCQARQNVPCQGCRAECSTLKPSTSESVKAACQGKMCCLSKGWKCCLLIFFLGTRIWAL